LLKNCSNLYIGHRKERKSSANAGKNGVQLVSEWQPAINRQNNALTFT